MAKTNPGAEPSISPAIATTESCTIGSIELDVSHEDRPLQSCARPAEWTMMCRHCGAHMPICDDHRALVAASRLLECQQCGHETTALALVAFLSMGDR